jgi:hypothetical protein
MGHSFKGACSIDAVRQVSNEEAQQSDNARNGVQEGKADVKTACGERLLFPLA